jgi:DNA mismatch repair protein MSH6
VTQHLVTDIRCRTLFATHYHTLCDDFAGSANVALGHMGCLVEEGEAAEGGGPAAPRVTFLYKFAAGACPKSYGLNVARLARLPESIIL